MTDLDILRKRIIMNFFLKIYFKKGGRKTNDYFILFIYFLRKLNKNSTKDILQSGKIEIPPKVLI